MAGDGPRPPAPKAILSTIVVILAGRLGANANSPRRVTPPLEMIISSRALLSRTSRLRPRVSPRTRLLEVKGMQPRPIVVCAHTPRTLLSLEEQQTAMASRTKRISQLAPRLTSTVSRGRC